MIDVHSEAELAFYVVAICVALIPLAIRAIADVDTMMETRRANRLAAQRRGTWR